MRLCIAACFVLVVACSPPKGTEHKLTVRLDEYFQKHFPSSEPGGAVLLMKGNDTLLAKGYGLADLVTREQVTTRTLFNLGSISKTFVANAILLLQEQKKLSVNDHLSQYFPEFKNASIAERITIANLLTHTSGLPDNRQIKKDSVFYLSAKDAENWYPVTQTDTLMFEAGEKFEYSNPAFNALALIVEKVSGMKWQKFVEENIFTPSGMSTSTITDGAYPDKGVSHAYIRVKGQWQEKDYGEEPTFAAAGNGGVWSSVIELEQYEQSLQHHRWLSEKTISDSRTVKTFPNWKSKEAPEIGWSWFIGQTSDSLKTIGHTGSQGGFLCNYVTVPEKGIRLYILCNTPRDLTRITSEVLAMAGQE